MNATKKRDAEVCAALVMSRDGWPHSYPCGKRGRVQRGGKWYCGTHDPLAREAKDEARRKVRAIESAVQSAGWRVADREKNAAEAVASFGGDLPAPIAEARAALLKARADLRSCKAQLEALSATPSGEVPSSVTSKNNDTK